VHPVGFYRAYTSRCMVNKTLKMVEHVHTNMIGPMGTAVTFNAHSYFHTVCM